MLIAEQLAASQQGFATIDPAHLDTGDDAYLDMLPFSVIALSADGVALTYSALEVRYAGLQRANVLGRPFFLIAGVCMNNYLVAQRYEDEEVLDTVIDYVLTYRMRPTPVKLRLIKRPDLRRRYLLIRR